MDATTRRAKVLNIMKILFAITLIIIIIAMTIVAIEVILKDKN